MKTVSFARSKFNSMLPAATISMAIVFLMTLSDTVIVGNLIGEDAISAVNVIAPVYSFANFIAALITMGTSYLFTAAIGSFNTGRAERIWGQGVILSAVTGLLLFLLMLFLENAFFRAMNLSGEVWAQAAAYWQFERWLVLITPFATLLKQMVYSDGDERCTVLANGVQVVGNILLSTLFTIKLGTRGARLGSFLGTLISLFVLSAHFLKAENALHFRWHLSRKDIHAVVTMSLSSAILYLCWALLALLLNMLVIRRFGDEYLPALTMAISAMQLTLLFMGAGNAMSPVALVYQSEGNAPAGTELAAHALVVVLGEGVCAAVLLLIFAPVIPALFAIREPTIAAAGTAALRYLAFSLPFSAALSLLSTQYLLVNRIALSVAIILGSDFLFPLLFCRVLCGAAGLRGVWFGFVLAAAVSLLVCLAYVLLRFGRERFPWLTRPESTPLFCRSLILTQDNIMQTRDDAGRFLAQNGVSGGNVNRVMLLIEELSMLTAEKNGGKRVIAEISVLLRPEEILVTGKDTGCIYDLTETDNFVTSFRSYFVSSLMTIYENRSYVTTINFNRNSFRIPRTPAPRAESPQECAVT